MAKKTTTPTVSISIDAVKEQVKTALTPKDAQGNLYLTETLRTVNVHG